MTQSPSTPLPPPKERRRLRKAQSLTQAQVAARVGVARETVRSWETGRTTPHGQNREVYARLLTGLTTETSEKATNEKETNEKETNERATNEKKVTAGQEVPARVKETVAAATPVPSGALTPAQAFDALYAFCAPALVRQTYLLTGRRELARESVERAFQLAWQNWTEVALDRDPAGWVRATAYECALSPWHRLRPRYRHPEPPPADATDRALMDVLLKLPPPHRRTLLLYDGVGLDLPDTAAETEASTPATANRLLHAREAIAERLPELSDPAELHRRLAALASTERLRAAKPPTVRNGSERRARFWTRAAIAFTVALIGTTALTLRSAPTQYEPPVAPGSDVRGVPKRVVQGPLSDAESELREKLRKETAKGPQRLVPTLP